MLPVSSGLFFSLDGHFSVILIPNI